MGVEFIIPEDRRLYELCVDFDLGNRPFILDKSNCQNLETPAFVKIEDLPPESF